MNPHAKLILPVPDILIIYLFRERELNKQFRGSLDTNTNLYSHWLRVAEADEDDLKSGGWAPELGLSFRVQDAILSECCDIHFRFCVSQP